jgi:hypothetical protein
LPSAVSPELSDTSGLLPSIFDDAGVIQAAIGGSDGPVAVVAHSYGGVPVTQATANAVNVAQLIYVTSVLPDVGESVTSLGGHAQPDPETVTGAIPPPGGDDFYGDVPTGLRADAVSRLVPQSARSFADQVMQAGWHSVPSSYIVCDKDQAILPAVQEQLAVRTGEVHHLASGHSPFLSMPSVLTDLLIKILQTPRRGCSRT